jgi:long-subunit acyl-CoA synthetase (AMP-forming)
LSRNRALIVLRSGFAETDVDAAVAACNKSLPDYARISEVKLLAEPFTTDNGLATANGRLRRLDIEKRFGDWLYGATASHTQSFSTEY